MPMVLVLVSIVALGGCAAPSSSQSSERAWAVAECRNIIDKEAEKKCLDRVNEEYGRGH